MNPNQLHQATAILMDGVLRVEWYPASKPEMDEFDIPNSIPIGREWDQFRFDNVAYNKAVNNWLASKVSYPVKDNGLITLITSIPEAFIELRSGIAIDSILHRIDIVDGMAVLKGEEVPDHDFNLSLFGNYLAINGIKLMHSNHVEESIQQFLKSDYYLTRKTK